MKYITGIHALNLRCSLETCGDWHQSGIQWTRPTIRDSAESVFGDFGIEKNSNVPENPGTHWVADHIRALLDLLAEQSFGYAQGMKNDFICNDAYTPLIFDKVQLLSRVYYWPEICEFMGKEYGLQWLNFLQQRNISGRLENAS